jgi:hypothetical protein
VPVTAGMPTAGTPTTAGTSTSAGNISNSRDAITAETPETLEIQIPVAEVTSTAVGTAATADSSHRGNLGTTKTAGTPETVKQQGCQR